jgi:predicted amidohydrolase
LAAGTIGLSSTLRGDPLARKTADENPQSVPGGTGIIRIGLYQVICSANSSENLDKFAEGLGRADREHVEIVCFPECFLTGYAHSAAHTRAVGISIDSPKMKRALEASSGFETTAVVGFGELRGDDYHNSAAIIHKGRLLGVYSKCSAYEPWEKQGREFPVFQRGDVKFGVIICSDGGYIEPARILAAKGAKIVFAPHNNYIDKEYLLEHYRTVRSDHTARAVENSIYFVRGNNYVPKDPKADRVGYGDSYIVDPFGEIVARARQYEEDFVFADLNLALARNDHMKIGRSLWSQREFGKILAAVAQGHRE